MAPAPIIEYHGRAITADVHVGPASFTVAGWPAEHNDEIRGAVKRRLGSLYPPRQITVDVGALTIDDHRGQWSELASAIAQAVYWADCYRPLGP